MTPIAIAMLLVSMVLVWGGLTASIVFLVRRPDVAAYPPGGIDDARGDETLAIRDT